MKKILYINSSSERCGVSEYGRRIKHIISKSKKYKIIYKEVKDSNNIGFIINLYKPDLCLYNYHCMTLGNLEYTIANNKLCKHIVIYHEFGMTSKSHDAIISVNSDMKDDEANKVFSIPRPLLSMNLNKSENSTVKIGTYGFLSHDKNIESTVDKIIEDFDEAILNFNFPINSHEYDLSIRNNIISSIKNKIFNSKKKLTLNITDNYFNSQQLIEFLNENDLNIFSNKDRDGNVAFGTYRTGFDLALSATTDYALMSKKPFALSKSNMFRHFESVFPSIYYEDRRLNEIMESGFDPFESILDNNNEKKFLDKFEFIMDKFI